MMGPMKKKLSGLFDVADFEMAINGILVEVCETKLKPVLHATIYQPNSGAQIVQ